MINTKHIRHLGLGILAVGTFTFTLATPVQAQLGEAQLGEEEVCAFCSFSFGKHKFSGITCTAEHNGCFSCDDTPDDHIGCHAYQWEGECGDQHSDCEEGGETLAAVQDALLEAAEANDHEAIAHLISVDSYSRIHFNADRQALQVTGCTGALVAHIPLPRQLFAAAYAAAVAYAE